MDEDTDLVEPCVKDAVKSNVTIPYPILILLILGILGREDLFLMIMGL